jgi:hypothetical protein
MTARRQTRKPAQQPRPRAGERRRLVVAALAAGVVVVALLIAVILRAGLSELATPAGPAATPTVDARLILHPHASSIDGALQGGVRLHGTLSPTLPGHNTVDLVAQGIGNPSTSQGRITLSATMPGMAMPPVRATLAPHGGHYTGAFDLPMFGTYVVQTRLNAPGRDSTGVLTVTIPLPGF